MNALLTNWKTSLAGAVPVLGALTDLATMASSGHWDGNHLLADMTALGAGIGLLFAKDATAQRPPK
jgi:hypothetical protein